MVLVINDFKRGYSKFRAIVRLKKINLPTLLISSFTIAASQFVPYFSCLR